MNQETSSSNSEDELLIEKQKRSQNEFNATNIFEKYDSYVKRMNNTNKLTIRARTLLPEAEITSVSSVLMSNEDIEKICVVEVKASSDGSVNIYDSKMGPTQKNPICDTCGQGDNCLSHCGYIKTPPFYHNMLVKQITEILNCVCAFCSSILFDASSVDSKVYELLPDDKKLEYLSSICMSITSCRANLKPSCTNNIVKFISKKESKEKKNNEQEYTYNILKNVKPPTLVPIKVVQKILNEITDEDAQKIGFNVQEGAHPRNLIIERVVVLPNFLRNELTKQETHTRNLNYTNKYRNIAIKSKEYFDNSLISNIAYGKQEEITKTMKALQIEISNLWYSIVFATYNKNTTGSNRSLSVFMKGANRKKGWLRKNVVSQRVDYSGRTVVTGNIHLNFGQVGIPEQMLNRFRQDDIVTLNNINTIKRNMINGEYYEVISWRDIVDGNRIFRKIQKDSSKPFDSSDKELQETLSLEASKLHVGDCCRRKMKLGDTVLINRQPTLSKMSFLSVDVLPIKGYSIQIPQIMTTPFNADFDGDEMNIHAPQSIQAQAEAKVLMSATENLLSIINGGNTIGLINDILTAFHILSLPTSIIYCDDFFKLLNYIQNLEQINILKSLEQRARNINFDLHPSVEEIKNSTDKRILLSLSKDSSIVDRKLYFRGVHLFSICLPRDFNYQDSEKRLEIKSGIVIRGKILKMHVGVSQQNSIIRDLSLKYSRDVVSDFFTNCNSISREFLRQYGFSLSLSDVVIEKNKLSKIKEKFRDKLNNSRDKIINLDIENASSKVLNPYLDLNAVVSKMVVEDFKEGSPARIALDSESKFTATQQVRMSVALGLQTLGGEILKKSLNEGKRMLSYYSLKKPDPIENNGFCDTSYNCGLSPANFTTFGIASRQTTVSSKQEISDAGVIKQEIEAHLSGFKTTYLGGIQGVNKRFMSIHYFGDEFDPSKLHRSRTGQDKKTFMNCTSTLNSINSSFDSILLSYNKILNSKNAFEAMVKNKVSFFQIKGNFNLMVDDNDELLCKEICKYFGYSYELIQWEQIDNIEEPIAIYKLTPEGNKEKVNPLYSHFISMLVNRL